MTAFAPSLHASLAETRLSALARPRVWVFLAWLLCTLVHLWLISAGRWTDWPGYTARYDMLSRGFLNGGLHLPIEPDPRLLTLADPYSPTDNRPYRLRPFIHDSVLYNGKFYVYWGPAPALLLMPVTCVLPDVMFADQAICFVFAQGILLAAALLLLRMRDRFATASPPWLPAAGLLLIGFTAPMASAMTRAAVYEAAILGGQFFLLLGVWLAWRACAGDAKKPTRTLLLAGIALSFAVGCRVSLAIAVTVVGVLVCARLYWENRKHVRVALPRLAAFGLPLVVGAMALAAYNVARFDSPAEFGQKYQLGGISYRGYPSMFALANLWPGLWSYLLRPPGMLDQFPWIVMQTGPGTFPAFVTLPPRYETFEPIAGLLWSVPVVLLLPIALVVLWRRGGESRWLTAIFTSAAILGFGPAILMLGSTQRYLGDLLPSLLILIVAGICVIANARAIADRSAERLPRREENKTPTRRSRVLPIFVALTFVSIVLGLLLSIDGYGYHFRIHNPSLLPDWPGLSTPTSTTPVTGRADPVSSPWTAPHAEV